MGSFTLAPEHQPLPFRPVASSRPHLNKRYLIIGGAGDAGKAAARTLISEGAAVIIADVRQQALDEAVTALQEFVADGGVKPSAIVIDMRNPASIAAAITDSDQRLGGIDGLVNYAAIVRHVDPLETPWSDWEDIFAINVYGAFEASKLVAKVMMARGIKGAIVNIASEAGKKGHTLSLAYSASKAAVISFTRILSQALAAHDINVNCICPGGMAANMLREVAVAYGEVVGQAADEVYKQLIGTQLRRHVEPEEVARVAAFLLSDAAMLIRGQAINADGGDTPY